MRICKWKNSDCVIFNDVAANVKSSPVRVEVELAGYEVKLTNGDITFAPISEISKVETVAFKVTNDKYVEDFLKLKEELNLAYYEYVKRLYKEDTSEKEIVGFYLHFYPNNPYSQFIEDHQGVMEENKFNLIKELIAGQF